MIRVDAWMPFYWGDYWKATHHLSDSQHVVYLKTISAYWADGESLENRKFRSLCGREFWVVSEFYKLCDGRWHHTRIDKELAKARARASAAHDKAMKMVAARRKAGQLPEKGEPQ